MTARHWCITINNPCWLEPDWSTIAHLRYAVGQIEEGAEGTRHFQAYVELTTPVRFSAFKKTCLTDGHYEKRKGSRDQARDYCMKADTRKEGPWEFGRWELEQGRRTDIEGVTSMIEAGASYNEIALSAPVVFIKYHRGIKELLNERNRKYRDSSTEPEVIFIYGKSGCGKSRKAEEIAGKSPIAHWQDNGKWWDGYQDQEWVVLDDFAGSSMAYKDWKRLVDRYGFSVETKGGVVQMSTHRFVITSTRRPDEWWDLEKCKIDRAEIYRRITKVLSWQEGLGMFVEINKNSI